VKPIEFLKYSVSLNEYQLNPAVIGALQSRPGDVSFVSLVGSYQTGKSFLANCIVDAEDLGVLFHY